MGIPRLTSFVDNTFTSWQREEITGNLIIDGYSMCYNLYSFDWSHGGQLPEFQSKVAHFFISMSQSGITPIVVMDGIDYKEEKTATILRRRADMIKTIHKHTANMQKRNIEAVVDHVLPPLAPAVFYQVMFDLKVKFVVADGEGDQWIYQLANEYSCPVLSADSDFLMYKLRGGYIPFNRFHWEASPINAEVYYYRAFCEQLKFKDDSLRLVIAAIAGNDFVQGIDSPRFMAHIARQVAMETKGLNRLINVVKYIQLHESLEDFIEQIKEMAFLDNEEKKKLEDNCLNMQAMYDSDDVTTLEKMAKKTELLAFNSEPLPDWVLKQFREGNFSSFIMEALVVGKGTFGVFVDNSALSSCVHASLPIRQCIYGLTGSSLVTEYYREGLEVAGKGIHSLDAINRRPFPSLDRIPTLSAEVREQLFLSILGCDSQALQGLQSHWKLVMAATTFWYQHTKPSHHLVKALILSFLVCSTCPHELTKMRSEFFIPVTFRRSPKWMPPLHAFAQWQATYLDAMGLNQLLMLPLEQVSPASLYDGKLAMFFTLPENGDHLAHMLPIDHRLFTDLVGVILPQHLVPRNHHATTGGGSSSSNKLQPLHKRPNQPPRFQNAHRAQQGEGEGERGRGRGARGRGRGRGGHYGNPDAPHHKGYMDDNYHRELQGQGVQSNPGNYHHHSRGRGGGFSSRGRNRGAKASTPSSPLSPTSPTSPSATNNSNKSASRIGSKLPKAKVVHSTPPKFTHANRYAALGGEDEESEDEEEDPLSSG